jgi:hypothetical protein
MCPSCQSADISRSRKRKLKDSFMRWMGKVAYRCRECQRRFYVNIDVDRRLRRAKEWQRRSAEHISLANKGGPQDEDEDPLDGYEEDMEA